MITQTPAHPKTPLPTHECNKREIAIIWRLALPFFMYFTTANKGLLKKKNKRAVPEATMFDKDWAAETEVVF